MPVNDAIFQLVRQQLLALDIAGLDASAIGMDSLLIEDVGIDSLKFVTLTVLLEDALGVREFPMQHWVDECRRQEQPLTVAALVRVCSELLDGQREVRGSSGSSVDHA
jgi:acyl carrier protein